jgi:2'-5' RNA ligase
MTKRVFIAIDISKTLQEQILQWEQSFRQIPARWLAPRNLHITLVPPWHEKRVEEVKQALNRAAAETHPFEVQFHRVAYGPHQSEPRLIWAKGMEQKPLSDLKNRLKAWFGQKDENRPWTPHLTLARFRPRAFSAFAMKQLNERVDWIEKVDSVVLMESHLLRGGAEYEVLHRVQF